MKNPIKTLMSKRPSSAADIENELARLGQKLADHQRRRTEVMQALEDAKEALRAVLAEEDEIIAQATGNVQRLEAEAVQLGKMVEEYEAAVAGAEERFRLATEEELHRAAVQKLEKAATAVDAVAPEFEKAVAAVSAAVKKMIAAVPGEIGIYKSATNQRPEGRVEGNNDMVSIREVVGAILAESLYYHFPDQFDAADGGRHRHALGMMLVHDPVAREPEVFSWERRRSAPLPTAAAIDALLTSRLRKRAKAVAGGDPEGDVPEVKIIEPYRAPPPPPEIEVVGLKHFKFLDGNEGYKPRFSCVMKGSRSMIRVEVAQHAIALGAAALVDSVEGKQCLAWRASVQSWGMGPELSEYDDIGDPLGLHAAYEGANARDAARSNQVEVEEAAQVVG